jgi:squalene synthase HpnC
MVTSESQTLYVGGAVAEAATAAVAQVPDVAGALADLRGVADRAAGENFPVASRLVPKRVRTHLLAIYGFARLADDIGDESAGDRLPQLDWLESELDRAFRGEARHPVLRRLTPTIHACSMAPEPFRRLVEANRRDQTVHRYETWAQLREYCSLSADPVGRLVLRVFDADTPVNVARSDDVCTALQVIEHLQDVGEDYGRGRVYLPGDELDQFGCPERDLGTPPASAALRRAVAFEAGRARELLGSGVSLVGSMQGSARVAVAGFVAGGYAALDAIERAEHDVLSQPAEPSAMPFARRFVQTLVRSRRCR